MGQLPKKICILPWRPVDKYAYNMHTIFYIFLFYTLYFYTPLVFFQGKDEKCLYKIDTSYACTSYYPDATCIQNDDPELTRAIIENRCTVSSPKRQHLKIPKRDFQPAHSNLNNSCGKTPLLGRTPQVSPDIELQGIQE